MARDASPPPPTARRVLALHALLALLHLAIAISIAPARVSADSSRLRGAPGDTPARDPLAASRDPRPVVGVLTQPYPDPNHPGTEYVAASYVKFLESAGLRVVPIRYSSSREQLGRLFRGLSGALFPGGGDFHVGDAFYTTAATILEWAVASNKRGETFPVFGTCLGWELLAVIQAGNNASVLDGDFVDEGRSATLAFARGALNSTLFARLASDVKDAVERTPTVFLSHHQGVTPRTLAANARLARAFRVLATAKDALGKEFVAAVQGRGPELEGVMGVQFHPEKSVYEWYSRATGLVHSSEAVRLASTLADAFGSAVRASKRRATFVDGDFEAFRNSVHAAELAYNGDAYFTEVYLWRPTSRSSRSGEAESAVVAAVAAVAAA